MANRWGTMERVVGFIWGESKITADGDCSHEIKRRLLAPWKESYDQPRQRIKKQRHYFTNKGPSSQSYDFSSSHVWTWELDHKESWALKIDAFELWCWRRLLRVPWTARRSNQSILKEISPGISLEGMMLSSTLATSCKELTHWKRLWCWEGLGTGGEGDDRGWDGCMASLTQWTRVWVNSGSWWWTGRPGVLRFMGSQRVGHNWATKLNWTELFCFDLYLYFLDLQASEFSFFSSLLGNIQFF